MRHLLTDRVVRKQDHARARAPDLRKSVCASRVSESVSKADKGEIVKVLWETMRQARTPRDLQIAEKLAELIIGTQNLASALVPSVLSLQDGVTTLTLSTVRER